MHFLNSLYQKTLLKIPKIYTKVPPLQLWPAGFLFAWPLRGRVYNGVLELSSRTQSLPFASARCHKASEVFVGGVI